MSLLKNLFILTLAFFVTGLFGESAEARGFRVGLIPNGSANRCANCHNNPSGGGPRDLFGEAVRDLVSPGGREEFWGPALAAEDSDMDGFTNGEELGDPDGDGVADRTVNISFPGRADDSPLAAVGDCNLDTELNHDDLSCVSDIAARDAVLAELNTLPGDLDGNGDVAFPDFLVLSGNFGNEGATYAEGNIDLTGAIDFPDFLTLSGNFGQTPPASASGSLAAVPEPSGVLLSAIGMLFLLRLRSRRN